MSVLSVAPVAIAVIVVLLCRSVYRLSGPGFFVYYYAAIALISCCLIIHAVQVQLALHECYYEALIDVCLLTAGLIMIGGARYIHVMFNVAGGKHGD